MANSKGFNISHVKKFIRQKFAKGELYVKVKSHFDGMTDGVEYVKDEGYELAHSTDPHPNNLGVAGVWLVGGSRDYLEKITRNGLVGYSVSNSCGSFEVLSDTY